VNKEYRVLHGGIVELVHTELNNIGTEKYITRKWGQKESKKGIRYSV
jgi:hypothetical protein